MGNGIGSVSMLVFDTEESRITGGGGVDFRNERVDVTLRPEAKKPGLLSIRGPIHIPGPFRDVSFAAVKDPPSAGEKGARDSIAPIVEVPQGHVSERQSAAPIVNVPATK